MSLRGLRFPDPERPFMLPPPPPARGLTASGVVMIVIAFVGMAALCFSLGWDMAIESVSR